MIGPIFTQKNHQLNVVPGGCLSEFVKQIIYVIWFCRIYFMSEIITPQVNVRVVVNALVQMEQTSSMPVLIQAEV